MSESRPRSATHGAPSRDGAQRRAILVCLTVFLAAIALTYGWNALTRSSGTLTTPSFVVRAALSAVLIFFGAFVLTGLWFARPASAPSAEAAPASQAPAMSHEDLQDGENTLPPHIPVRAADLPRILFDTNEFPAITPPKKRTGGPPIKALRPPVAWPQHPESQLPESQE